MTTPAEDVEKATAHITSTLGPPSEWWWPGGWPGDIEAALVDAVFSARAVYRSKNGKGIYANVATWRDGRGRPSWSLDGLIAEIDGTGVDAWACHFGNRQHSPTRPPSAPGGPSKAAAVREAAEALREQGINMAADIGLGNAEAVQQVLRSIPGIGGATPIAFSQAEDELRRLLRDFGPPRTTTPAYPFHHLTSDGFWLVSTAEGGGSPGASPAALRRQQAAGRLVPELARDLHGDPALLAQLAHVVLDSNFEPSLHEDICAAVGLSLEEAETGIAGESQRRRDLDFPRRVLIAYEFRCAFCGYDGSLDGAAPGLEAAHVRWWTHGGPNEVANGICLCSIHHKLSTRACWASPSSVRSPSRPCSWAAARPPSVSWSPWPASRSHRR